MNGQKERLMVLDMIAEEKINAEEVKEGVDENPHALDEQPPARVIHMEE